MSPGTVRWGVPAPNWFWSIDSALVDKLCPTLLNLDPTTTSSDTRSTENRKFCGHKIILRREGGESDYTTRGTETQTGALGFGFEELGKLATYKVEPSALGGVNDSGSVGGVGAAPAPPTLLHLLCQRWEAAGVGGGLGRLGAAWGSVPRLGADFRGTLDSDSVVGRYFGRVLPPGFAFSALGPFIVSDSRRRQPVSRYPQCHFSGVGGPLFTRTCCSRCVPIHLDKVLPNCELLADIKEVLMRFKADHGVGEDDEDSDSSDEEPRKKGEVDTEKGKEVQQEKVEQDENKKEAEHQVWSRIPLQGRSHFSLATGWVVGPCCTFAYSKSATPSTSLL